MHLAVKGRPGKHFWGRFPTTESTAERRRKRGSKCARLRSLFLLIDILMSILILMIILIRELTLTYAYTHTVLICTRVLTLVLIPYTVYNVYHACNTYTTYTKYTGYTA